MLLATRHRVNWAVRVNPRLANQMFNWAFVQPALNLNLSSVVHVPPFHQILWMSKWVGMVLRPHQHSIGHFGDESFQSITCTGTEYWQPNKNKLLEDFHNYTPAVWPRMTKFAVVIFVGRGMFLDVQMRPLLKGWDAASPTFFWGPTTDAHMVRCIMTKLGVIMHVSDRRQVCF